MKTLAALGLLLFSGVLVVSGAMMGTLEAGQDVGDPVASRPPGLREIRVYLRGPDGRALPRDRVNEASILVQPVTSRPGEAPAGVPGGTLSRRLALQWVEPRGDRRERVETRPGGQERRDGEGVEARVLVLEPETPDDEGGGYWRAAYAPPSDPGVAGFETTVIFKDRGLTRTIAGFVHPPADRDGGSGDPAVK